MWCVPLSSLCARAPRGASLSLHCDTQAPTAALARVVEDADLLNDAVNM
jgi:hypothetical protein